jgi:transposase InsO family protein
LQDGSIVKEATPWNEAPKYPIQDNDRKYGRRFSVVARATGIEEIPIPFGAPDANAVCERFGGSLRRECLDHMLVLNQKQLNVITRDYVDYHNRNRPHQGLTQRSPIPPAEPPT